ncbi:MAG: hypothetical protein AB1430_24185 [Pseudomonadota bacterium]
MNTRLCLPTLALVLAAPLLGGCVDKDKIATVADAENQLFTPDGRLIVTGGTGVFEIVRSGEGFAAQPLQAETPGACNYTGLAQIGGWVFAACQQRPHGLFGAPDNHLLAAQVASGRPLRFVQVERAASPDPLDTLTLPNGLAKAPGGHLLVADYNLFGTGGVARVTLDFAGSRPRIVGFEKNWLAAAHGINHPNGVRVSGNELFVSEFNAVKRYQFDAAGAVPLYLPTPRGSLVKNEVTVHAGASVVDDIQPLCGGVAITDYLGGQVLHMAPAGRDLNGLPTYRQVYASGLASLQGPSSVQVGRAPLFDGHDVLVTEKGLLLEFNSSYGNRLSRVKSSLDLGDPASCVQINGR